MRPAFALALRRVVVVAAFLLSLSCLSGCGSELALVAADQNSRLTVARNDEMRGYVVDTDRRQRAALEVQLDLTQQLGEKDVEAEMARDLAAAIVLATPDAASGAASRPYVTPEKVAEILARQEARRAANREAIAAKRKSITAQLDAELLRWLNDPKARQQERVAAQLAVYARAESEFARFIQDIGAGVGVGGGTNP